MSCHIVLLLNNYSLRSVGDLDVNDVRLVIQPLTVILLCFQWVANTLWCSLLFSERQVELSTPNLSPDKFLLKGW